MIPSDLPELIFYVSEFQSFRVSEFQSFRVSEFQYTGDNKPEFNKDNMTVQRFEDLEIWKNARELCRKIRDISDSGSLGKDYSLKDQILRSCGSCMDNIAEGYERDGKKEFLQYHYISKGSLGETRSQVHRCSDAHHLTEDQYSSLLNDCLNLSAQIKKFINYLAESEYEGHKKR